MNESRKSVATDFLSGLLMQLLADIGWDTDGANRSRDEQTVLSRCRHRGLGFLTVDLPLLGNHLLRGLETGHFVRPSCFKGRKKSSSIPAFLQGHFKRLFDDDGILLQDFDPHLVQELLQMCFLAYKVDLPFSPEKTQRVVDNFVDTEGQLPPVESCLLPDGILRKARLLLERLFEGFDPKDIVPRHGPGAVSTGEKFNEKYDFKRKYDSIHQYYPYYDYFVCNRGPEIIDRVKWYRGLTKLPYGVAKVILVPKDARGPRLISEEPLEYQWIQQGLGKAIVRHVEHHPLTRGFVNFTDQSINQDLAKQASIDGGMATLDLKDASDRVSCALVRTLFPERVADALFAARSGWTSLPCKREIPLKKYAPMGSALCFPVMALSLWAISQSIVDDHGTQFQEAADRRVEQYCYVYGDDLVVPTDVAQRVLAYLPGVHLCANESKSFFRGYFRESCGGDFYKGVRVTPLRAKSPWTADREDGRSYVSYIAMANALYERGFWRSSQWILDRVKEVYGRVPMGTSVASYPCVHVKDPFAALLINLGLPRQSISRYLGIPVDAAMELLSRLDLSSFKPFRWKWDNRLQSVVFKLRTTGSARERSPFDGWSRLLYGLTTESSVEEPQRSIRDHHLYDDGVWFFVDHDPDSVFDKVVPRSTYIKRDWVTVA